MKNLILLLILLVFGSSAFSQNDSITVVVPGFTNDQTVLDDFTKKAIALYEADNYKGMYDMVEYKKFKKTTLVDYKEGSRKRKGGIDIENLKAGNLILGKLYLCGQCPNLHLTTATGFVINADGTCVTNNHVFNEFSKDNPTYYLSVFAMDHEGNVYPIKEVLAANKDHDLAVFKIETDKPLTPLTLGERAEVGSNIHLLSHPDRMYYTYTKGYITRSYLNGTTKSPRHSISADFAKGSSGAPIFNDKEEVIGVVSSTRTIKYSSSGNTQMVVKEIIPIELLKEMCSNEASFNREKRGVPGGFPSF
ncbi:serine protease [Tamlana sp. 2201CG12-4]|uniref:S1 family peptidase n=1 Tax=Tamlana sp. 2201CG12-4 TaxID=3112582 RepID=UPI002DBA9E8A|nr:serine protease [Tamlana sp. 2201CG12-4]MEC3906747.1 serine protease [Tamlana sp. 2201CG12-4]